MNINYRRPLVLRDADPMDSAAADVDISYPLIRAGSIENLIIRSAVRKDNPEKQSEAIVLTLETTRITQSVAGPDLPVGFRFNQRINGASGKRERGDVAKDVTKLIQAVEGKGSKTIIKEVWNNPGAFLDNKPVQGKITVTPEKDGFDAKNEVKWVIPA